MRDFSLCMARGCAEKATHYAEPLGFWCDVHALEGDDRPSPRFMAQRIRNAELCHVITRLHETWKRAPELPLCVMLKEALDDYPAHHGDPELLKALEAFRR